MDDATAHQVNSVFDAVRAQERDYRDRGWRREQAQTEALARALDSGHQVPEQRSKPWGLRQVVGSLDGGESAGLPR